MRILTAFVLVVFLFFAGCIFRGKSHFSAKKELTIAFYNVENLFDTIPGNSPHDEEFSPQGRKKWSSARYDKKLSDIAKVLSSLNPLELPEIIGFAEVENQQVLKDLVAQEALKSASYGIVHHQSPDYRGIDVALIFRKDEFKPLLHKAVPIVFPFDTTYTTRDILYVKGLAGGTDTLHLFVNHWKSRSGGEAKTEKYRIYSAKVLRNQLDSIQALSPGAKIFAMGDMNDEPQNKSLDEVLGAKSYQSDMPAGSLLNLMYAADLQKRGTYSYKGNWNMLDNMVASQSLLANKQGYALSSDTAQIFKETWILYQNPKIGSYTPNRTYGGPNYFGGYSDHLPVFVRLRK